MSDNFENYYLKKLHPVTDRIIVDHPHSGFWTDASCIKGRYFTLQSSLIAWCTGGLFTKCHL